MNCFHIVTNANYCLNKYEAHASFLVDHFDEKGIIRDNNDLFYF